MRAVGGRTQATLTLARTFKYFGFGDVDDYVVLDGDRVIGRIFKPPQALSYRPWFWTITAIEKPPSVDNRGYAATREDAMANFKARLAKLMLEPEA